MAYSVPGGEGECVALEIADGAKTRKVVITTPDAARVALAIEEARARKRGSGVRIDADAAVATTDDADEAQLTSPGARRASSPGRRP